MPDKNKKPTDNSRFYFIYTWNDTLIEGYFTSDKERCAAAGGKSPEDFAIFLPFSSEDEYNEMLEMKEELSLSHTPTTSYHLLVMELCVLLFAVFVLLH